MTTTTTDHFAVAYTLYEREGSDAVCRYGDSLGLPYRTCGACECRTPVLDGLCLVCAQPVRPDDTPDRRLATPEHRERVHRLAQDLTALHHGDLREALEDAKEIIAHRVQYGRPMEEWGDVMTLLQRRADTLNT